MVYSELSHLNFCEDHSQFSEARQSSSSTGDSFNHSPLYRSPFNHSQCVSSSFSNTFDAGVSAPHLLLTALLSGNPLHFVSFSPPASLIIGGLIANGHSEESVKNELAEERNRLMPRFRTHVDDYLQFSPLIVAYGLDAFGMHSKTDILNRTVILIKGEAFSTYRYAP